MKIDDETKVLDFLTQNPKSIPDDIAAGTKIFKLQVHKILNRLFDNNEVSEEIVGGKKFYSFIKPAEKPKVQKPLPVKKHEDEGPAPEKPGGRDNSKFKFNGLELGKGALVREIIVSYCAKHSPLTLSKLAEVFPDSLMPHKYGVIREVSAAKKLSGNRNRFFLKPEQIIKLADKKSVAVTNQVSAENIKPFLKAAKALGFVIK